MPTYTYEIVSQDVVDEPRRFEMVQKISDAPLTLDPESGEPVMRVITGGVGVRLNVLRRSTVVDKKSAAATACGCATGGPHSHRARPKLASTR